MTSRELLELLLLAERPTYEGRPVTTLLVSDLMLSHRYYFNKSARQRGDEWKGAFPGDEAEISEEGRRLWSAIKGIVAHLR